MPKRRQTRAGGRSRSSGQRPRGNPAARSGPPADARPALAVPMTPGASGIRQTVERISARPLFFLVHLPKWVPMVVALGLLITGFIVRGPGGAAALLLVAVFLGWLAYMSWPRINTSGRVIRVLGMASMLVIVAWQARR